MDKKHEDILLQSGFFSAADIENLKAETNYNGEADFDAEEFWGEEFSEAESGAPEDYPSQRQLVAS